MPLTAKGSEVLKSMEKTYGSKEKAEQVLYASKNAGKITGIDSIPASLESLIDAVCSMVDSVNKTTARLGAMCDDRRVIGGVGHGDVTKITAVDEWSEEAREAAARAKGKGVAERLAARKKERESGRDRELTNLGKGPMAWSGVNKREGDK